MLNLCIDGTNKSSYFTFLVGNELHLAFHIQENRTQIAFWGAEYTSSIRAGIVSVVVSLFHGGGGREKHTSITTFNRVPSAMHRSQSSQPARIMGTPHMYKPTKDLRFSIWIQFYLNRALLLQHLAGPRAVILKLLQVSESPGRLPKHIAGPHSVEFLIH